MRFRRNKTVTLVILQPENEYRKIVLKKGDSLDIDINSDLSYNSGPRKGQPRGRIESFSVVKVVDIT